MAIVEKFEIGKSVNGIPIEGTKIGTGEEIILIVGGTHGDEVIAYELAESFLEDLLIYHDKLTSKTVYCIPHHNPDAIKAGTRVNANIVDINRNFDQGWLPRSDKPKYFPGKAPLSEPESLHMADFVNQISPSRILSIHSPLNFIDFDGEKAKIFAELMAAKNNMKVQAISYETPGSFGKFCLSKSIPLVTLELPRTGDKQEVWLWQREALWAFVNG